MELREGEEQLEDLHTLTCFYLAQACLYLTSPHLTSPLPHLASPHLPCFYPTQAHGNLGARDRSAAYCHTTMMRQLTRRGCTAQGEHAFQPSEWAKNAQQIAAYYASGASPNYHP
jgi:hypothetical protein